MFGATFNLNLYTCQNSVIFGTLKDASLWINSLASNNCFNHRNVLQNGINILSKMVIHFFVEKLKILYTSDQTILFKFHQHVVQILFK